MTSGQEGMPFQKIMNRSPVPVLWGRKGFDGESEAR